MHDDFACSPAKIIWRKLLPAIAASLLFFVGATSTAGTSGMISTLLIGGARIDVIAEPGDLPMDEVLRWVKTAGESVTAYYGRFPVPRVALHVTPFRGSGVRHGMTFGAPEGGRITIRVGSQTTAEEFASDWMLTHEMIHLSFPSMEDRHHWIEEGIATYVEPIARIQAGHLTAEKMWSDLVRDMPRGLPRPGDEGLDHTHTWGRTYWGGAMFCLLADVEIRRETKNAKGLQQALRAVLDAAGDIRKDWDIAEAFRIGDRATGTTVLEDQYAKMKDMPVEPDLDTLWAQLGVRTEGKELQLDDQASLAAVRRAITEGSKAAQGTSPAQPNPVYAGRARSN